MFRYGSYVSLVHTNNRTFLEGVHDESKVKVYRATPVKMEGDGICLDSGEVIRTDAWWVFATGWKPSVDFFESDDAKDLGIPHRCCRPGSRDGEGIGPQLGAEKDDVVTKTFPRLARWGAHACQRDQDDAVQIVQADLVAVPARERGQIHHVRGLRCEFADSLL